MQPDFTSQVNVSRRTAIKSGLFGFGVYFAGISGCDERGVVGSDPASPQRLPRVDQFVDRGHRLYGITLKPDSYLDAKVLEELNVQLLSVFWRPLWQWNSEPPFQLAVWVTDEEAQQLAALPEIDSIVEKSPEHIGILGSIDETRPASEVGLLAVQLLPTQETYPQLGRRCASVVQVVQAWREAARELEGVVVNPGPEPVVPEDIGEVAEGDQIVIHFTTPSLDPTFLDTIRKHPQVIAMRWGDIFTYLHCPPCGMG